MSNLLASVLGTPPTYPKLSAADDDHPAAQSFPTTTAASPAYDNTSSVPSSSSAAVPAFAAGALGDSGAENLKGGVVGADYSATTLQGAHFPTSSATDDHPGGVHGGSEGNAGRSDGGSQSSSSTAFAAPALGAHSADNLRGGAVGPDYSASTLQGAHFPTSAADVSHPGGGGPVADPSASGKGFASADVHAQAAQAAEPDFAPTSANEPSGTDRPGPTRDAGGAAGDAVVDGDEHEKKSVKDKLKTGLNKVLHPKSGSSGTDAAPPEPSYRELYDQTVTSKLSPEAVRDKHLSPEEVADSARALRRDEGPGFSKRDLGA